MINILSTNKIYRMKNLLQTILLAGSLLFIASCSSDDPEPAEGSGTWKLESFVLADFPAGFTSNENTPAAIDGITFGGFTYTNYTLDLNGDNTYDRTVGLDGAPSLIDDGLWSIEDEDLILENSEGEDEFKQEFSINIQEEKRLWISERASFGGWYHDDTLTALNSRFDSNEEINEYLNSLTDEEFAKYLNTLEIDLIYAFIKEEN